jgi:predicted RecA/RadA family phage recombinase
MKNMIEKGDRLVFTVGADTASGAGVLVGKRIGVACSAILSGAAGVLAMEGVFNLPKLSTDVIAQGDLLYWDNTNKRLTSTTTSNTLAGYAQNASGNGVATVDIMLNR